MVEFEDSDIEHALQQFAVGELGELRGIFISVWWWQGSDLVRAVASIANRLYDDGHVDFPSALSSLAAETNPKENGQFATLFWAMLPELQIEPIEMAQLLNRLVAQGTLPGDLDWQSDALLHWCRKQPHRAEQLIILASSDTEGPFNGLLAAIVAGAEFDPQKFTELAIPFLRDPRPNLRTACAHALGLVKTDDPHLKFSILTALSDSLRHDGPNHEIGFRSAIRFIAQNQCADSVLEELVALARNALAPPMVLRVASQSLAFHSAELSKPKRAILSDLFSTTEKLEADVLQTLDHFLYRVTTTEDWREGITVITSLLQSNSDITIGNFSGFSGSISTKPERLEFVVLEWLRSGEPRLCRAAGELISRHGEDDFRVLHTDNTAKLASEDRIRIVRRTLGHFLHLPLSSAAILMACMVGAERSDRIRIAQWLLNHLLMNYSGALRTLLENEAKKPSNEFADDLAAVLSAHKDHMKALGDLGRVKELEPSSSQRFMAHEKRADDMEESSEIAESKSTLLSLFPKRIILYGNKSVTHIERGNGVPPVRSVLPMQPYEFTTELPKETIFDPVGLNYRLFKFAYEDDNE